LLGRIAGISGSGGVGGVGAGTGSGKGAGAGSGSTFFGVNQSMIFVMTGAAIL